jgi:23S rRNA pseudouridine1911/1915/1917 synthase
MRKQYLYVNITYIVLITNGEDSIVQISWSNDEMDSYGIKAFLGQHGVSHRMYNELKRNGQVLINQQLQPLDYKIMPHDKVTVIFPPEVSDDEVAFSNAPLDIVFEDTNWLVVNKPAGLTSVPGPSNRIDTLVNRIKGYLKQQGSIDLRPHLITRLDRFTPGLVLVAKHRLANSLANQLVARHAIDKKYYALVSGEISDNHEIVDLPIGRPGQAFRREVMENGQQAQTEYWVVQRYSNFTWLRLKLHTGRTHQIRVHMTALCHPLLGDELYAGPLDYGIERQALHAYYLKFKDPLTQQEREFTLPLPADMQHVIEEEK